MKGKFNDHPCQHRGNYSVNLEHSYIDHHKIHNRNKNFSRIFGAFGVFQNPKSKNF